MGLKIARITDEKKLFFQPKEYFVETSQSYTSVKPILICHIKENHESIHFIWTWIQRVWQNCMKSFTIKFHSRDIVINFPSPKVIGDGKEFLNLLNASRVFCYLCLISSDHAQNLITLDKHGRKIERNLEQVWQFIDESMQTWKDSKTKKSFIEYFPAETRKKTFVATLHYCQIDFHFKIYLQCISKFMFFKFSN